MSKSLAPLTSFLDRSTRAWVFGDSRKLQQRHDQEFDGRALNDNEAMTDAAIGMVAFCGEYQEEMPLIGCSGCNSETMAYVAQAP